MKTHVPLLLSTALTLLVARPLIAAPAPTQRTDQPKADEFTGFEKAPFGSTPEEFKKLYPKAEVLKEGEDLGAPTVGGAYITRLVLKDQPVTGLAKPTTVELRFWKRKLWGVIVYYGDNDDKQVLDMLTKRLGPSGSADPDYPLWERSKTQTAATVKQRWYGINDLPLSKEAQAWFALLLTGQWKGPTQEELIELGLATPAATTPGAATPASAAPAAATASKADATPPPAPAK